MLRIGEAAVLCLLVACASGNARPDGRPGDDAAVLDAISDGAIVDAPLDGFVYDDGGPPDTAPDDAPGPPIDGPLPDDGGPIGPVGDHLLLTEVVLQPTEGELVEIFNPTGVAITLTDYYLADTSPYYQLPAGTQAVTTNDFIARFPSGATIGAHTIQTVAIATAAEFSAAYGVPATYSLGTGGPGTTALVAVDVGANPTLTNAGESIALFHWDGESDLVADVDLINAGEPTGANLFSTKSSAMIDGPDPDGSPSTYATDAFTLGVQASAAGDNKSTKRILPETGHEIAGSSGNGILGDDETSEAIQITWDHTPFTAPDPGVVAAALGPE
jgi:hypothetical protein